MLFFVTQTHSPENCPVNKPDCKPLFNPNNSKVVVHGIYATPPEHKFYFILETDDFDELQKFFMDGMTKTVVEIKPISKLP